MPAGGSLTSCKLLRQLLSNAPLLNTCSCAGLIAGIAGLQPGQQRDFNVPEPAGSHGHVSGELTCHVSMSELLVTEVPEVGTPCVSVKLGLWCTAQGDCCMEPKLLTLAVL